MTTIFFRIPPVYFILPYTPRPKPILIIYYSSNLTSGSFDKYSWGEGILLIRKLGFSLPRKPPQDLSSFFRIKNPQAIDLVQQMLMFDPNRRITAEEILNHPFISEPKNDPFSNYTASSQISRDPKSKRTSRRSKDTGVWDYHNQQQEAMQGMVRKFREMNSRLGHQTNETSHSNLFICSCILVFIRYRLIVSYLINQ